MRSLKPLFLPLFLILFIPAVSAGPCEWPAPDPWDGLVPLPPECPDGYEGLFYIVARPGHSLSGPAVIRDVILTAGPGHVPNEFEPFTGELFVRIGGTGSLAGFTRDLTIPVEGVFQFDAQTAWSPAQTLSCSIFSLQGQLFGDPDFCDLVVTGGQDFGLPSPGSTTLTEKPDGTFNVDSFFDITYRVDFTGCPGSILEGYVDSMEFTERFQAGEEYIPVIDHNCQLPDNGTGAIEFPPGCPEGYVGHLTILDGLAPGTEISGPAVLRDIMVTIQGPGGSLGGEFHVFDAALYWEAVGSGEMEGFYRTLYIPVSCEAHTGPHNPGDPVQVFGSDLVSLQGQLFGDPDFCDLEIVAGDNNGLPSPGSTTTTKLPTGDFAVDSFFDITYEISFTGCPASIIEGLAGTTTAIERFQAGEPYIVSGAGDPISGPASVLHQNSPNPFNPMTVIRYELPPAGSRVALDIFDVRGRHVLNLVDGVQPGGAQAVVWNGADAQGNRAATGVYFYKLTTEGGTLVRKMAVLK